MSSSSSASHTAIIPSTSPADSASTADHASMVHLGARLLLLLMDSGELDELVQLHGFMGRYNEHQREPEATGPETVVSSTRPLSYFPPPRRGPTRPANTTIEVLNPASTHPSPPWSPLIASIDRSVSDYIASTRVQTTRMRTTLHDSTPPVPDLTWRSAASVPPSNPFATPRNIESWRPTTPTPSPANLPPMTTGLNGARVYDFRSRMPSSQTVAASALPSTPVPNSPSTTTAPLLSNNLQPSRRRHGRLPLSGLPTRARWSQHMSRRTPTDVFNGTNISFLDNSSTPEVEASPAEWSWREWRPNVALPSSSEESSSNEESDSDEWTSGSAETALEEEDEEDETDVAEESDMPRLEPLQSLRPRRNTIDTSSGSSQDSNDSEESSSDETSGSEAMPALVPTNHSLTRLLETLDNASFEESSETGTGALNAEIQNSYEYVASALFSALASRGSALRSERPNNTRRPSATNSSTRATRAPTEVWAEWSSEEESDGPPPLQQIPPRLLNNPRSRATELHAEPDSSDDSDSDGPPPLVSLRHTNAPVIRSDSSDDDLPALEPIPSTSHVSNSASNNTPQPQNNIGDLRSDSDDDDDDAWVDEDDLPSPSFAVPPQFRAASNRYRVGAAAPHAVHQHRQNPMSRDRSIYALSRSDHPLPPLPRTSSIFGLPLEFSMGEDGQTYISFNVGNWTAMPGGSVERTPNPARARVLLNGFQPVPRDLIERVEALEKSGQAERDSEEDIFGRGGCSICYEPYTHPDHDVGPPEDADTAVLALPCCHLFHRRCLRPWFETRTTCPNCRFDIDSRSMTFPASDSDASSASQQRVLSWTPPAGKSLRVWIEQREQRLNMEQLSATFRPGGDLDAVD